MMKSIIILDDSAADRQFIEKELRKISEYELSIMSFSSVEEMTEKTLNHADLLLLDIEMTEKKITTLPLLDHLPKTLPVILVSNLSHYQRMTAHEANVKAFVPKDMIDPMLREAVATVFSAKQPNKVYEESFAFPTYNGFLSGREKSSVRYYVREIRYIDTVSKNRYEIHFTNGKTEFVSSAPFHYVCDALKEQHISSLRPVSAGKLINARYIMKIEKQYNGRYTITLVGKDNIQFTLSQKYESWYSDLL